MPAVGLAIASTAPDFQLPDHRGGKLQLSAVLSREAVLLVFFPFAFNDVCAGEMRALQSRVDSFHRSGVKVIAVSCDSPYALAEFAEREQLTFDLASDFWPHGRVSDAYGVLLDDKGFAIRASFLIDRNSRVAWSILHGPAEERDAVEYEVAIASLV